MKQIPGGKTTSTDIQKIPGINKDGKVGFMKQYESRRWGK
jgi:hypothetical protein